MNTEDTSVIILAGGSLKSKFDFIKLNSECPALLPINCKSIASYIVSFYSMYKNCKIYIVTNEIYKDEITRGLSSIESEYDYIFIPETKNVITSLEYSLEKIENKKGSVLVNLVTSIPTSYPEINEIQFSDQTTSSNQWSGIIKEAGSFHVKSKNTSATIFDKPFHAFTGIFHLSYDNLTSFLKKKDLNKFDLFSLFVDEDMNSFNFKMGDWLDCGHEINYYETKAKLISSRSFNRISFADRGVIVKRSSNIDKLEKEANYFKLLPTDISLFFPRLIKSFRKEGDEGVYDLEFYGYPNIAELIMYWDLSDEIIKRMFDHFNLVLKKFKTHPFVISKEDFVAFYRDKLFDRVDQYFDSLNVEDVEFLSNEITVNGVNCKPFSFFKNYINDKVESLYDVNDFCVMHGDFCYNNILYDIPGGIVRLIDPRGSFGDNLLGIYGDRKYDIAKLSHSAIGGYDFFVNNNYEAERGAGVYDYSFGNDKLEVTSKLMKQLILDNGYKYNDIKFITATLFISMCPLHKDSPKRQLAFFIHGLKILNEVYEEQ